MHRPMICLLMILFFACSDEKQAEEESDGFNYGKFSEAFKTASLPFQLSDTFLLNNKDTVTIKSHGFSDFIPDSVTKEIFGKAGKVKYVPLYKVEAPKAERYFIVKATSGKTKAALLFTFNEKDEFGAVFTFLVPDPDPTTQQISSIDKSYSISRGVIKKRTNAAPAEGKDVYVYNNAAKDFTLIMTDPLDDKSIELINPIDTLAKTHKLAGDFVKDKRNIVSIRNGRKDGFLTVFVHIEKGDDCTGEIKGDAEITSPTMAVYRQPGDPCVLQFTFSGSSVKLTELEGCGSRRSMDCIFNGSFSKKKDPKAKSAKPKKSKA